jgi:hypothetical protein
VAPPVWVCALCCVVEFVLVAVLEPALLLCCSAPPLPVAAFVAFCCAVEDAVAVWSVEALWTVDCDCPPLPSPPVWTAVLVWLVELLLLAEEVALFELD